MKARYFSSCILMLVLTWFTGCCEPRGGGNGGGGYNPKIDPANFVSGVNNQYMPLTPGTTLVYQITIPEGIETEKYEITDDTKTILGVTCMVVYDTAWSGDTLLEETYDWFAQDVDGNVWYFGEDTKEYDGSTINTEGTWQAGVNGGKPGIVMLGTPKIGTIYRQEYAKDVAEDLAEILSLTETVPDPHGCTGNCLETKDYSPIIPGVVEHKYFAPGIGQVSSSMVQGGTEEVKLIDILP